MKPLAILAGAAVILGAIAFVLTRPKPAGASQDRVLPGFRPEEVAAIRITDPEGNVEIRRDGEDWKVIGREGVPANLGKIARFLRSVWELRPVQSIPVEPAQLGRLRLAAPSSESPPDQRATLVEFLNRDSATIASLSLGKLHIPESTQGMPGFPAGRYVLAGQGPDNSAFLVSETFDDASTRPSNWIDKTFVSIPQPVSIERKSASDSWKVIRRDGDWHADGSDADKTLQREKIQSAAAAWTSPFFDDIAPADAEIAPDDVVQITGEDGVVRTIRRGKDKDGYVPVTIESALGLPEKRTPSPDESPEDSKRLDEEHAAKLQSAQKKLEEESKFSGRAYLVPAHSVDALFLSREDLFQPPPPPPSPETQTSPTPEPSPSPTPRAKRKNS